MRVVRSAFALSGVLFVLNFLHEDLGGLECGNLVLGNDDGGVLGDVAGCFFGAYFDDEATEAAEVHVFAVGE